MTETMGASFLTWNVYDNNPGQIGGVLPSLEFCLLDVSETMNKYSIKDEIPKGELCVRGSTVSAGYFRNAQETRAAIDQDGWLHTGDIAALLPNGGVQIIDRKKNIFKLAQVKQNSLNTFHTATFLCIFNVVARYSVFFVIILCFL